MPAVAVPRTWTAGETVTAAMMNSSIRDILGWLIDRPYVHAYQTVSQSITDVTAAPISMGAELRDTLNGHSTSVNNSRYIPNTPGSYLCLGQVSFQPNAAGQRLAQFRKNGAAVAGIPSGAYAGFGGAFAANGALALATMQLNGSTDYVELWGNQNSGVALSTDVGTWSSMMIILHIGN